MLLQKICLFSIGDFLVLSDVVGGTNFNILHHISQRFLIKLNVAGGEAVTGNDPLKSSEKLRRLSFARGFLPFAQLNQTDVYHLFFVSQQIKDFRNHTSFLYFLAMLFVHSVI